MHWFFTGLLIAVSAGTVAFTGHLLRRLFTTGPGEPGSTDHPETGTPEAGTPETDLPVESA